MKAYVINLPSAKKRREAVVAMLSSLDIPFELVAAVDGRAMPAAEMEHKVDMEQVRRYPGWLTPSALGCALSHLEVYRRIANGSDEMAMVLEDDIVLHKTIKPLLSALKQNPGILSDKMLCFYLVDHRKPVPLSVQTKIAIGGATLYQVANSKGVAGSGGYLVHRDVAQRFVTHLNRISVAADSWSHFRDLGIYESIWCTYPFLGQPGFFESTIGYVRNKYVNVLKGWVERLEVPVLYQLLKRNRKKIWEQTSRVELI